MSIWQGLFGGLQTINPNQQTIITDLSSQGTAGKQQYQGYLGGLPQQQLGALGGFYTQQSFKKPDIKYEPVYPIAVKHIIKDTTLIIWES